MLVFNIHTQMKKQLLNYINKSIIKHFTQLCTNIIFSYGITVSRGQWKSKHVFLHYDDVK